MSYECSMCARLVSDLQSSIKTEAQAELCPNCAGRLINLLQTENHYLREELWRLEEDTNTKDSADGPT